MRTSASYAAWSLCGWKRPSTSPTTRALFTGLAPTVPLVPPKPRPMRDIEYRMRRCTGFWPSDTSGSARPLTTLRAYSR